MNDTMKIEMNQMLDYIMKNCLWQFHSRTWDREKQNTNIIMKTTQILCDEPVEKDLPADRCYWVDAMCLADAYRSRFLWINTKSKEEIKQLMQMLKDRLDVLTITGSLNAELTDPHY